MEVLSDRVRASDSWLRRRIGAAACRDGSVVFLVYQAQPQAFGMYPFCFGSTLTTDLSDIRVEKYKYPFVSFLFVLCILHSPLRSRPLVISVFTSCPATHFAVNISC